MLEKTIKDEVQLPDHVRARQKLKGVKGVTEGIVLILPDRCKQPLSRKAVAVGRLFKYMTTLMIKNFFLISSLNPSPPRRQLCIEDKLYSLYSLSRFHKIFLVIDLKIYSL